MGGQAHRAAAASRYRVLDSALRREGRHSSDMIVASSRGHSLVVKDHLAPAGLNPASTASHGPLAGHQPIAPSLGGIQRHQLLPDVPGPARV
jgi:hypothetical protein